jgi:sulfoxide reductase heme-binding subunit YedZ
VVHAAALLGDAYFHPTIPDLLVPFVMDYKEPYMAIGIIAGWGMVIFGLSYYARERIGVSRWKVLHRLTAVVWVLGVIHTLGEGTDAGQIWYIVLIIILTAPVAVALGMRLLTTPGLNAPRTEARG